MKTLRPLISLALAALLPGLILSGTARADRPAIQFSAAASTVACYDFLEVTLEVTPPPAGNPFTDVRFSGAFGPRDQPETVAEGFCDAQDGSVFRIRFMPRQPGPHDYRVTYQAGAATQSHRGTFEAVDERRKGLLRVDTEFPTHFRWEGTQERFFWNGTTAYSLGSGDSTTITRTLERLDRLRTTQVSVALNGAGQPWLAQPGDNPDNPQLDATRFDVEYWRRFEHLLSQARRLNLVVSVVFLADASNPGGDPFAGAGIGGEAEQLYYRYALARLAPFSNLTWDLAHDYRRSRNDAWADTMGALVKQGDPYQHLLPMQGEADVSARFSTWADYALLPARSDSGAAALLVSRRTEQINAGRTMPLVYNGSAELNPRSANAGEKLGVAARGVDHLRRIAWETYLAGAYHTTAGPGPASGDARQDQDHHLIELRANYAPIHEFFTGIPFWRLEPAASLVVSTQPATGRATPAPALAARSPEGDLAVIYLPQGGIVTLQRDVLTDGLRPLWVSPRDAGVRVARALRPLTYRAPSNEDWLLVFATPCSCSFREHDQEFEGQPRPRRDY
jgi:hypothetical protein